MLERFFWRTPPIKPEPQDRAGMLPGRRGFRRLFDASAPDRTTSEWGGTPTPVDDTVRNEQRGLVGRARQQRANNSFVRRYVQMARQNIVGPNGIGLQAQARNSSNSLDQPANDAIEAAWKDWARKGNADVTGKLSWRQIQLLAVSSAVIDGEFFVRIVQGADAGPWGFALQMLDAQRCPVDYDVEKLRNGGFIRHGIEFNRYGRPLAYHFTTTDEEEQSYFYGGRKFVRIPAAEILHGFLPEMVGQKRGLPWISTALLHLRHLGEYEKASVINARVSASKGGFLQWEEKDLGPESVTEEEEYDIDMKVEPGMIRELPNGVKFVPYEPTFPHGEYQVFHKAMLRSIASGLGVAYNSLANDLTDVNFSSIRQGALDERDNWQVLQQWLIEELMEPVYRAWLQRALLAKKIKIGPTALDASRVEKYSAVGWQPRRWQWVDPRADVDAAVKSKDNLLTSPSQLIRESGRDPDATWREIASDIARMRAAGIDDEFIKLAINSALIKQPAAPQEPSNGSQQ